MNRCLPVIRIDDDDHERTGGEVVAHFLLHLRLVRRRRLRGHCLPRDAGTSTTDITPDGRQFLMVQSEAGGGYLNLVTNWLQTRQ